MPKRFADEPILAALYDYWWRKRRSSPVPDRRDIDPLEIGPSLLPHLGLLEIEDGAARVRYRLLGTALVERFGRDPTGLYLHDVMSGTYLEFIQSLCRDVYVHRCPVYAESLFRWDVDGHMHARRLYLPLTDGGSEVAIALIGQVFHAPPEVRGEPMRALISRATVEQERELLPLDE
jgi:hypothetical protein